MMKHFLIVALSVAAIAYFSVKLAGLDDIPTPEQVKYAEEIRSNGPISFSVASVPMPVPIVQLAKVDSSLLAAHDFQDIGGGCWYGWALSHDRNGVIIDSFPVFVLSDKALDVDRDGRVNILDLTHIVNFLFRGGGSI